MKGRRLPDSLDGTIPALEHGDYVQIVGGTWYDERRRQFPDKPIWICCAPNGHMCSLNALHGFTEHEDGTLTVTPSILISDHTGPVWHGYLRNGEWSTA